MPPSFSRMYLYSKKFVADAPCGPMRRNWGEEEKEKEMRNYLYSKK